MRFASSFRRFAAILSILGSLVVCSARAQDAREIAKKAFPSVVMLLMEDNAGQPLSLGSGFIVKEGIVATNLHVVAGSGKGYAKFISQKTKHDIMGYVAIDEKSDLVLLKINDVNAPVLSLGDSYDIAAFRSAMAADVNRLNPHPRVADSAAFRSSLDLNAPVLSLGDSSKVSVGDEIFVIGNPQGLEGTFSKGIVSSIRSIGQDSLLQITAPISPGSSGGPILNQECKVVGVAVATLKEGQNLNFGIPVSYLSALLADTKTLKPLKAEKTAEKKTKSILSDFGGRNTEGVVGGRFLWDQPILQWGHYSFSLQNKLRQPIKNVWCLVIFYDGNEEPIDVDVIRHPGVIPAGLAKRVTSMVDNSVQKLTTREREATPHTKLQFRILDFQIVEESEEGL